MIANTAPVAWGAIGTPVHTLAAVSGLPEGDLNAMLGRILPITFTAMGCPAADFILEDVRARLLREADVEEVVVNVVWDPPWTSARLTRAGRDALEMWGLAV